VLWRSGALALWRSGALLLYCSGALVLWCFGAEDGAEKLSSTGNSLANELIMII